MGREEIFAELLQLKKDRTALVIVDMQQGFMEEGSAMELPTAWKIVPGLQSLLTLCRKRELPVVFLEYVYSPQVPILLGELHPEHKKPRPGAEQGFGHPSGVCLKGEENVQTIQELKPRESELVIRKHGYNGFFGTHLDGALRAQKIEHLIVTGIMTDLCVLATVIGAFHHEYRLVVASDGTATLSKEIQEISLDIMSRGYARILTLEEIEKEIKELYGG